MFIHFWESVSEGGAEREGDRIQSRPQAPSCQHRAICGAQTHKLWAHDLSWSRTLNWLSHPGAPSVTVLLIEIQRVMEYFFNLYLFLRETENEQGRNRERGRHRIRSRLQALSCQHRAWHGARTHEPWDHDLSQSRMLNQLSHPGAPRQGILNRDMWPGSHNVLEWCIW